MHLRNADVWLVGALLLAGCALAGYALGQAMADEQPRAPPNESPAADESHATAHGPGAFRWLPLVGGIMSPQADASASDDRDG